MKNNHITITAVTNYQKQLQNDNSYCKGLRIIIFNCVFCGIDTFVNYYYRSLFLTFSGMIGVFVMIFIMAFVDIDCAFDQGPFWEFFLEEVLGNNCKTILEFGNC